MLLLQFSSVFKSSSTTVAGGCDVNDGEIADYFPSPRANKCHAYSWIRNVTGTMTRHTMCVQGRYGHSFDLISVKSTAACVFPLQDCKAKEKLNILMKNHKKFHIFVAVRVYPEIYIVMTLCSPPCRWGQQVPPNDGTIPVTPFRKLKKRQQSYNK